MRMIWLPSGSSWLKALLFIFATSLMLIIVRILSRWSVLWVAITDQEDVGFLISLFVALGIVIPIVIYGYVHYVLFGKAEHSRLPWLISGDSLLEGVWMWIVGVISLIITVFILYGLDRPLIYTDNPMFYGFTLSGSRLYLSEQEAGIIGFIWLAICAYLYHWRTLTVQWVKRRFTKK